jgi:hypothetical protein
MIITRGLSATETAPTRHEWPWADLVKYLVARTPFEGPKGGEWLCFSDFGGAQRAYANLVAANAIALDFDTHEPDWATLAPYTYCAWTTHGHAPNAPRWRVVIPLVRGASIDEYKATWQAFSDALGGADGAAKDAARLNYLPGACVHPEHARFRSNDGAPSSVCVPAGTTPSATPDDWTDEPVPGYNGPEDDDTLLAFMLAYRQPGSAADTFGAITRFEALWNGDAAYLATVFPPVEHDQQFDHTKADALLANELVYYTGGNCERALGLMQRAPLCQRDKWREDKGRRAITLALTRKPDQYHFLRPIAAASEGAPNPAGDAAAPSTEPVGGVAQPGDFYAYLPAHDYIHRPTGMHWPAASLDGTVGKDSRMALDLTHPVHLESWAPGFPERFQYAQLDETRPRAAESWVYNYYQAPRVPRISGDIQPWLDLVHKLYPSDAEHIIRYFADAVQNPGRKTNHALVLGSEVHGIGKDSMLRPLKWAVGERNYASINPAEIFDKNNAWAASVVVQISESRNVGDGDGHRISKYDMYERCKDLAAAPPTTLSCQDKWKARHEVRNCCRVIYTTNHGVDGIYLPPQDRRHYCAWSDAAAMSEADSLAFHKWCDAGGAERVAHYLTHLDISTWNPGARPPQTAWWWRLVREAEGDENPLSEAIERMGAPAWLTAEQLAKEGGPTVAAWFADVRNRKNAGRHLGTLGYRRVENPADKRGRFNIGQVRVTVYGKPDVTAEIINRGR